MNDSAKLIAITQPTIPGITNAEELIAYCARVSNSENQYNTESAPKLLAYCIKNNHWSVFETVSATIEIKTTRDIARQILRHKSFNFQEFSQRYSKPDPKEFTTSREARLQDNKNRQSSIDTDDYSIQEQFESAQQHTLTEALFNYNWAIDNGIAKEQARIFLPEGLTPTRLYMTGNLRSWITYIALREKNGTQKEHMQIATKCKEIISREFPSTTIALGGISSDWII